MSDKDHADWNPLDDDVLRDQVAAYDALRQRCPVAFSEYHHWSLFSHTDVLRVLEDHQTFSNAVSVHLSVPNGMDPPEHTAYRKAIEPYFDQARMAAFEPICRQLAAGLASQLVSYTKAEIMSEFAEQFAVQVQCEFLGWPRSMRQPLADWSRKNQQATLARDRDALAKIADDFSEYIARLLQIRRKAGDSAPNDITTELLNTQVHNRPLREEEIVSILRNWTAGEIGTIAASVGILVHFLAVQPELQQQLREEPTKLPEAIDEILRLHGPLVSNRRLTTCPVSMGGRNIGAGERLSLNWIAANRDEAVFEDADQFRWGRDHAKNLLYGAGIHVCPGAPLARLELQVIMEELLSATRSVSLDPETSPENAVYPASGFSKLVVRIS